LNATQANGAQAAVVKTNSSQTVKYAKASGGEAPSFGDAATFTFADGDFLYIEVTAENGIDKNVYKIEVQVGRDTTLSSLSIGGVSVSDYGVPAAALADVVSGRLVFAAVDNTPRAIAVTPADSGAAVTWTAAETDPAETAFGTTTPLAFTEGGYLYVKVTAANGTTTAYYKIQIGVPAIVEKIEAGGSSVPVYRFTPPEGSTWGDYKTLAFTVMVADQTSYSESAARAHIVGNYPASNFIETTGAFSKLSSWNDARLVNISNGGTLSAIIGDPGLYAWKELSSPIVLEDIAADGKSDSSYTTDSYYPAADAAGPFYFGLGLTVNPNSAADRTVTYYIKDVALVKADGTKLLADDLATEFGSVTLGNLKCIFSNAAGAVVNRTLEAEPLPPSAAE
jgi:hypothetical protein